MRARLRLPAQLRRGARLELWADPYLPVGSDWEREIGDRIERTAVAVFLVSQGLLNSRFVRTNELGPLLAAGSEVTLCPVLVSPSALIGHPLLERQWVRGPDADQALTYLDGTHRQAAIVDIADRIQEVLPTTTAPAGVEGRSDLSIRSEKIEADAQAGAVWGADQIPDTYVPDPDALDRLRGAVLSGDSMGVGVTGRSIGLQGIGGVGKTSLARELVWDDGVRRAFPDGVLWLTLGQSPDLIRCQGDLLEVVTGERPALANPSEGRRRLAEALNGKRVLLVLDDLWDPQHARVFTALGPEGRYLLTTRDEALVKELGGRLEQLDVFSPEKALAVLARASGQEDLPREAAEVARECGYLGISLTAAGALAREDAPWDAILAGLRDGRSIYREHPFSDVFRSLRLSLDWLEERDRARYLELAVFPEDARVPEQTIAKLWTFTAGLEPYETSILLGRLKSRGLLLLDTGAEGRHASLHDLHHDFVRACVPDLASLHRRLVEAHQTPEQRARGMVPAALILPPEEPYLWRRLATHLVEAGEHETLWALLFDYPWLRAKLDALGVNALLADFDAFARDREVRWVRDAIELSAHVLGRNPSQLPAHLIGRLSGGPGGPIQQLLDQIPRQVGGPWLRPLRASLSPPGGAERRSFEGHTHWVRTVAVLPDGRFVSGADDGTLKLWEPEQGAPLRSFEGHSDWIQAVAVLPDGRFVSGSQDGTLKLWDPAEDAPLRSFEGHTGLVGALAVLPDGHFASGSADRTIKLWRPDQKSPTCEFFCEGAATALAVCNGLILAGDARGCVHVLSIENAS